MTIGIGVLASEGDGIKPNALVLLAHTKGSFGASYSMNRLHKLFIAPDKNLFAVGAGHIDKAAELFEVIRDISQIIPGGTDRYEVLLKALVALQIYTRECASSLMFCHALQECLSRFPTCSPMRT